MLILQAFGPYEAEVSASPFCVKAMCLLKMSGLKWRPDFTASVDKAPRGQFPVLIDGPRIIPDSTDIARYLSAEYKIDLTPGLDAKAKAQTHAISRMVEEHMCLAARRNRWVDDANWADFKPKLFAAVPEPMRDTVANDVRDRVTKNLWDNGTRMDDAQLGLRVAEDVAALAQFLGRQKFLFGDTPTYADASVAPFLGLIECHKSDTAVRRAVTSNGTIMAYLERCRATLYPAMDEMMEPA